MWKVIIVDDDKNVVNGIEMIIKKSSLNFDVAGKAYNGLEGLECAKQVKPDLIITDIYMPKHNGIEMIEELRKVNIQSEVIILSGYSEFRHARDALKLNIRDYLSKPASKATLVNSLKDIDQYLTKEREEKTTKAFFDKQLKSYSKNLTEELLEDTIKDLLNEHSYNHTQTKIISKWNEHIYVPVKFKFSIKEYKKSFTTSMMHFGINNIISDLAENNSFTYYYIFVDNSTFILLFEVSKDSTLEYSELTAGSEIIKDTLSDYFNVPFNYKIGSKTESWDETIDEIKDLLDHFKYTPDSEKITGLKTTLSQAIRNMNITAIRNILADFFEDASHYTYIQTNGFNLAIELFTIFKFELEYVTVNIYDHIDSKEQLYHQFLNFHSWTELETFFNDLIKSIEKEPVFEDNVKHSKLIQEAIDYVEDNIDKRFTLNEIADNLFISRNYLGKIFKEKMQMSFNEYVTQIRIEKARKKLLTGKYMIYEVAESVGYDNPAYFTAVFKKTTGYSPSKLIQDD